MKVYNMQNYITLRNVVEAVADRAENLNEDYSINWNFVDADAYTACREDFASEELFYEAFDEIAGNIIAERSEEAASEREYEMFDGMEA